jgi:endonuclease/exonuclease/phosphatase family metal-dependent hydrolase
MRSHKKPKFKYKLKLNKEIENLTKHRNKANRHIPKPNDKNVLIATWNLTNFGQQQRQKEHLQIMAEIIRPFDVVAIQEVADSLKHFEMLMKELGNGWDAVYTDPAGNNERLGYIYKTNRVKRTGLAAELAMRGYERAKIWIEGIEIPDENQFPGFNRNPYMVCFTAGDFEFTLVNVHLYWSNFGLRKLETMALAKWAKSRLKKEFPPNNDIILIGDFNMPRVEEGDEMYDLVTDYGLNLPKHTTDLIGTNLAGDADYDEVAFFPSRTKEDFTGRMGVFDFDNAIFVDLFKKYKKPNKRFFQYIRYYIADHRPMWAEFSR